jgi:hypothetical protein
VRLVVELPRGELLFIAESRFHRPLRPPQQVHAHGVALNKRLVVELPRGEQRRRAVRRVQPCVRGGGEERLQRARLPQRGADECERRRRVRPVRRGEQRAQRAHQRRHQVGVVPETPPPVSVNGKTRFAASLRTDNSPQRKEA